MKIDRRCFLSLGIGAAAGTALTPLPWKITDDLSIWTQRWPWTPVPPTGAVNHVDSVSTLCNCGCGITVRKIDDRAVKIEGRQGFPVTDGKACITCMSGLQLLYGQRAIHSPLKRVGERGTGKWQAISWDEALAEVSTRLKTQRKNEITHKVACITEKESGTVSRLFQRFLTVFGSPNYMFTPTAFDTYETAQKMMQGVDASVGFDLENSDFILSLGAGLLDGWGSSVRLFKVHSNLHEKGGTLVQVGPRLSNTAAKADRWIPVNPGTEGLLALGIAAAIIEEGLYSKKFVDDFGFGFEDWMGADGAVKKGFKSVITEHFSPGRVSEITGVGAGEIADLAKAFAAAKAPVAVCGRGEGRTPGSLHEAMAVHALNALLGRINAQGGVWAVPRDPFINWAPPKLDSVARKGLEQMRIDGAGSEAYPFSRSMVNRFIAAVNAAEECPVDMLLVSDANPCYTLHDAEAAKKALMRIPYIVSFAAYMDETSQMADIILPNHGHLERLEDVPMGAGINKPFVGLAQPVVQPRGDTRHTGDTLIALAKSLGETVADAFAWSGYEECLAKSYGDSWKTLSETGYIFIDNYQPPQWRQAFNTASKKFIFMSEMCKYEGGTEAAVAMISGDAESFPLVLIPYDSMRLSAGPMADTPFMIKTVSDSVLKGKEIFVEINAKMAGELGIEEGATATLATPIHSATVRVHLSNGIVPGVIAMPRGLGRAEIDPYIGGKGLNVNAFIGPVEDPASGLDAACGIRANLTIA